MAAFHPQYHAAKPPAGTFARRLLALEPWWILLLSPLLLLPGRLLPVAWQPWIVLATLLFWLPRWWLTGSVTVRTPVRLATLLFLLCIPLSIIISVDRARSWEVAGYLLLGVAGANVLLTMPLMQRRPQWIAWGLLLGGAGLALLGPLILTQGVYAARFLQPLQERTGPVAQLLGETINPNILANALLAILPLPLALALRGGWTSRAWLRGLVAVLTLLMMLVIVMTESRGAMLALAVVIPLLLALRSPRLLWLLLPLLLVAALLLAMTGGDTLFEMLTQASAGSATSGIAERMELWQRGLYAIQDFPITGIGLGTFNTVVPFLYPYLLIPPNIDLPDAHNLVIQVGVDLGIPGLVAWLALLLCLFVMMAVVLRRTTSVLHWTLAAGVLASLVGMLVAGLFAATNWGVKPAFLPWIVGALGVLLFKANVDDAPLPSLAAAAKKDGADEAH